MNVRSDAVLRADAAEAGIAAHANVGQLVITGVDALDLVDVRGGEAETGEIEILLVRVVAGDEARQRVARVHEETRRDRVDLVDAEALVVPEEIVADRPVVADILGPLQVREIGADI